MQILDLPQHNLQVLNVPPRPARDSEMFEALLQASTTGEFTPPIPQIDSPGVFQQGFYAVRDQRIIGYIMYLPASKSLQEFDLHPELDFSDQAFVLQVLIGVIVSGDAWNEEQFANQAQFYTYTGPIWRARAVLLVQAFAACNHQALLLRDDGSYTMFDPTLVPDEVIGGLPLLFMGQRFQLVGVPA